MFEADPRLLNEDGSPRDRIVGFETEYGLCCKDQENKPNDYLAYVVAGKAYYRNAFYKNEYGQDGNREYVDVNAHPELSTAEETSFLGAAHRMLAGHFKTAARYTQAGQEAADKLQQAGGEQLHEVGLFANTCSPDGATWGNHENILTSRELLPEDYVGPLALLRSTRIVWSGAGHVPAPESEENPGRKFQFHLSEKASHIQEVSNLCSTHNRSLVNTRDEAEADARYFRRIHDISGETVMSAHVNALRLASTSIVLRACELGASFDDLALDDPVRAMKQISKDPSLHRKVRLKNGNLYTGIDMQKALAERSINVARAADYLTPQESEWGEKWLKLLDDLQTDPALCARRVDWVMKHKLVERRLDRPHPGQSDVAVASAEAITYHRLLPHEGPGIQLLRRCAFEDSPSGNVLEDGLQLPETRAKLRGKAIRLLLEKGVGFEVHWTSIRQLERNTLFLLDPYDTDWNRVEDYLNRQDLAA